VQQPSWNEEYERTYVRADCARNKTAISFYGRLSTHRSFRENKKNSRRVSMVSMAQKFLQEFLLGHQNKMFPGGTKLQTASLIRVTN